MLPEESVVILFPHSTQRLPSCLVHIFLPAESNLISKISFPPKFLCPSNPPSVKPVTYILSEKSVVTVTPT